MSKTKSLCIGLDAASWDIMNPLINQGKLPNIQKLIDEGTSGTLKSTIPPMTPLAWTSIVTGVNPGKHGIYDMVAQDPETYKVAPTNYQSLTRPAIWDIFSSYNKKIGVINFPMAFPPPKTDSFFISGLGSPESEVYSYPRELDGYLRSKEYRIYPRFTAKAGAKKYLDEIKEITQIQYGVATQLMEQKEWQLFWIVFQGLDWIQHYLWNEKIDGENAVELFYQYMDEIVGGLIQYAKDDWNIIVLSDHGFKKIKAELHMNNLLEDWGYIKRAEISRSFSEKTQRTMLKFGREIGQNMPFDIKRKLKSYLPNGVQEDLREIRNTQFQLHEIIDWSNTKAFSYGYMGRVYIHTEGKYPLGIVKEEDYIKIREKIISNLKSLKDPGTGNLIVGEIFRKKDIYSGEEMKYAPDIVFNPSDFAYMVYGDFGEHWYHRPEGRVADHDMDGILIMKGNNFRKGIFINADAADITPTLLHLHKLPVLDDMDGRVLKESLNKELTRQEIKTVNNLSNQSTEKKISEESQEEVKRRLKELGYF